MEEGDSCLTTGAVVSWEVGCVGVVESAEAIAASGIGDAGCASVVDSAFAVGCTCTGFSGSAKRGFTSPVGNVAAAASHSFCTSRARSMRSPMKLFVAPAITMAMPSETDWERA